MYCGQKCLIITKVSQNVDFNNQSRIFFKSTNVIFFFVFVSLRFVHFEMSLLTLCSCFVFEMSLFRWVVLATSCWDCVVVVTSSSKSLKNPSWSRLSMFGRLCRSKLTMLTVEGWLRSVVFVSTFDAKRFKVPSKLLKMKWNEMRWKIPEKNLWRIKKKSLKTYIRKPMTANLEKNEV